MARYNEILVGRYARSLQKIFGMKGEVPVGSLAGELVPSHVIQSGAENRYIEAWDRFIYGENAGAVAAQTSGVQIRNPAGSNIIMVVEKAAMLSSAISAINITIGSAAADLPTGVHAGLPLDARSGRVSAGISSFSTASPGGLGNVAGAVVLNANTTYDFLATDIHEFPILPGTGIRFVNNTVNTELAILWIWRERFLEESERS